MLQVTVVLRNREHVKRWLGCRGWILATEYIDPPDAETHDDLTFRVPINTYTLPASLNRGSNGPFFTREIEAATQYQLSLDIEGAGTVPDELTQEGVDLFALSQQHTVISNSYIVAGRDPIARWLSHFNWTEVPHSNDWRHRTHGTWSMLGALYRQMQHDIDGNAAETPIQLAPRTALPNAFAVAYLQASGWTVIGDRAWCEQTQGTRTVPAALEQQITEHIRELNETRPGQAYMTDTHNGAGLETFGG
jgi:hypothetical protein